MTIPGPGPSTRPAPIEDPPVYPGVPSAPEPPAPGTPDPAPEPTPDNDESIPKGPEPSPLDG